MLDDDHNCLSAGHAPHLQTAFRLLRFWYAPPTHRPISRDTQLTTACNQNRKLSVRSSLSLALGHATMITGRGMLLFLCVIDKCRRIFCYLHVRSQCLNSREGLLIAAMRPRRSHEQQPLTSTFLSAAQYYLI